jgi:Fe-S-cluster-containing dehydrogenase component/DMSO reductase anchor subunit
MRVESPKPATNESVQTFLAELLAEQTRLDTPVARFASAHSTLGGSHLSILSSQLGPQLIPLSAPRPGEHYAFEVDLDSCTGCKSCVAACHSLNGLDETETWRDVGLLVSPDPAHPFTQTVTTACHHCADPGCLNGCPVLAYEKDPLTGIVRHLDDQCIGCSYCILKCPYDVPKFSTRLGIVRKCDLCHTRLAAGEAPACAQACPTHAIRIVTVPAPESRISDRGSRIAQSTISNPPSKIPHPKSPIRNPQSEIPFLPSAPDPALTRPTTRYVSRRPLPPGLIAADAAALRVQPAHTPLVALLTLVPAAIGCSLAAALGSHFTYYVKFAAVALGAAGLAASALHLGQPLRAWRIFLGWRRSWLTREALAFGLWFALAAGALVTPALAWPAALVGLLGLGCSAMIYVDTHRSFWRAPQTFPRFFGTAVLTTSTLLAPAFVTVALLLSKLAIETRTLAGASSSARLQRGPLRRLVIARALAAIGAIPLLFSPAPLAALLPLIAGEALERLLFFRAVDAPKMPGQPA